MDNQQIRNEVSKIWWYHSIDLGHGITTPGAEDRYAKLNRIGLNGSLKGKTVLDIGAYDGLFSFEAERLGAKKVVATDYYIWVTENGKKGFLFAREILNSKVEDVEIDVFDISPDTLGVFDVVLFLGVFYHLKNPCLALEKVADVTKEKLILETEIEFIDGKRPLMFFYPTNEANNDHTNWWGPNPIAVKEMLKVVGFKKVQIFYQTPIKSRIAAFAFNNKYKKIPFFDRIRRGRITFHAWK